MDIVLTDEEVRILGCLIEKEMATPEYYPLSLNALVNGCNQKSNRMPVVSYDQETVLYGLQGLQERKLVRQSNVSRVPKYEQIFTGELKLIAQEAAILSVLLLRGPQTVGEIRGRTERLYRFSDLDEVEKTLTSLEDSELVSKLARQPGRKESRYAHLLSGQPAPEAEMEKQAGEPTRLIIRREDDRLVELESVVAQLRDQLTDLQKELAEFKAQFD